MGLLPFRPRCACCRRDRRRLILLSILLVARSRSQPRAAENRQTTTTGASGPHNTLFLDDLRTSDFFLCWLCAYAMSRKGPAEFSSRPAIQLKTRASRSDDGRRPRADRDVRGRDSAPRSRTGSAESASTNPRKIERSRSRGDLLRPSRRECVACGAWRIIQIDAARAISNAAATTTTLMAQGDARAPSGARRWR